MCVRSECAVRRVGVLIMFLFADFLLVDSF